MIVVPAIPPVEPIAEPTPALIDRIIAANTKRTEQRVHDQLAAEFPSDLKRVGDTGAQIGLAGVLLTCGIKSNDWYRDVTYDLERHLDDLYAEVPLERRPEAGRFAKRRADETMAWHFGDDRARACREISIMPFVNNPLAFYPR